MMGADQAGFDVAEQRVDGRDEPKSGSWDEPAWSIIPILFQCSFTLRSVCGVWKIGIRLL
jgi:hypothetical protein